MIVPQAYAEQQILLPLSGIRISPADSCSPAERDRSRPQNVSSCQRSVLQAVYPWGLGWSRCTPRKVPGAPSLIPESHRDRRESMSCCRIAVALLSSCCRFDATFLESYLMGS